MARPPARRKSNPFDRAVLGVYRGPVRPVAEPNLTPYRKTLLRAAEAGEIRAGQGQYAGAWRWHHSGSSVTVTQWIQPMLGCGWLVKVGAHVELTDAGREALGGDA